MQKGLFTGGNAMDQLCVLRSGTIFALEYLPAKIFSFCLAVLQGIPRDSNEVLCHPHHAVVSGRIGND